MFTTRRWWSSGIDFLGYVTKPPRRVCICSKQQIRGKHLGHEWFWRLQGDLIVWGLCLYHAQEDIGGVNDLIRIQDAVLGSSTVKPNRSGALDAKATANIDVNLS